MREGPRGKKTEFSLSEDFHQGEFTGGGEWGRIQFPQKSFELASESFPVGGEGNSDILELRDSRGDSHEVSDTLGSSREGSHEMGYTSESFVQNLTSPPAPAPLDSGEVSEGTVAEDKREYLAGCLRSREGKSSTEEGKRAQWAQLQVLGQANLTYIVTQSDRSVLFVDQHAAHERVVFERLMKSWVNKEFDVQQFLLTEVIRLSEDAIQALLTIKGELFEMGLSIDQMGPEEIGINSAPEIIKPSSLFSTFEKLAAELMEKGGSFALEKYVGGSLCHDGLSFGGSRRSGSQP